MRNGNSHKFYFNITAKEHAQFLRLQLEYGDFFRVDTFRRMLKLLEVDSQKAKLKARKA